jgi:hypothetical protein
MTSKATEPFMPKRRLPIGQIIGRALVAPIYLGAASLKALARPILALTLVSLLSIAAGYLNMGLITKVIALVLIGAALLWMVWCFERHLLLGAAACEADIRLRQRYGLNLLILVIGIVLLAKAIGFLLQLALLAIIYLQLAASDNNPLPSLAYVLGWIGAVSVVGSVPARFFLLLPAAAAGHDVTPMRLWRLTRGNGMRLFLLLVILPGVLGGFGQLALDTGRSFPGSAIVASLLTAYGGLVYLAILALAYRRLSDTPLPDVEQGVGASLLVSNARRLWSALAIVLMLFGGVVAYDAFYRIAPGEFVQILRFGRPERIASDPGTHIKIPLIEDARPLPGVFEASSQGTYLTNRKEPVSLDCQARWRIVDAAVFDRTAGGSTTRADQMIGDFLDSMLRERFTRLDPDDIQPLIEAGRISLPVEETGHHDPLFDGLIEDINGRIKAYGIEVTALQIAGGRGIR